MRLVMALLLLAHGLAHFAGVREAFWPGAIKPRRLIYVPRALEGLSWLLLGLGFIGASALVLTSHDSWRLVVLWSSGASLLMCITAWPRARLGLIVDAVLVLLMLLLSPTSTSSYTMAAQRDGPPAVAF